MGIVDSDKAFNEFLRIIIVCSEANYTQKSLEEAFRQNQTSKLAKNYIELL
jgi:hypothetical protein